ncbi:MAG: DUF3748 domain-containing protein [Opitutaceae bacterium]
MLGGIVASSAETQLTSAPHGHVLTNVNVWSPDGRWIVYDVRGPGGEFDGARIERVEVATGRVETVYAAAHGARCGVVTYHPRREQVVFILGPEHPTPEWTYGLSRRRGFLVEPGPAGEGRGLDAMTYAPPFVPGALRGGSHVHVFHPAGDALSFTYDDEVLARLGDAGDHDRNQRNVAVAVPVPGGVRVPRSHPRNHDGDWFAVVVTRTVNRPRPGSDEISRAYEEGWLPDRDGRRRLACLGNVTAPDGREHAEVFVVELPPDLTRAGPEPLEGTATRRPAPPRGTVQRRLTFLGDAAPRGVAPVPRHWLRASPADGTLAFLRADAAGHAQLWTVSPDGGAPRQLTRGAVGVGSAFTWSPDGRRLAHVMDGSVCVTEAATGVTTRLTPRVEGEGGPEALACVYSPEGRRIAYTRRVAGAAGTHAQVFVVAVP